MEVIVALTIVFSAIGVAWFVSPSQKERRAMRAARRVRLREAPEGEAIRVVGRVSATTKELVSPASGKACAYYFVRITTAGKHKLMLYEEEGEVPFVVTDHGEHALVEPSGAIWLIDSEPDVYSERRATSEAARKFVAANRVAEWPKEVRIEECVLEMDEAVAIYGAGIREPYVDSDAASADYREGPKTRFRFASSPRFPLRISDDTSTHDR